MILLVEEQGMSFEQAAACSNVAKSTVWTWVWRWRSAPPQERARLSCLEDRPCRPRRCPRMLTSRAHDRVCRVRRRTGWGPRLIATEVGLPHATVHRALRRRGMSRRPRPVREAVVRYEWPCPGDLLHIDTKRFQRFTRPGHAVTGDRFRSGAEKRMGIGHEFVHSLLDDHSRLAYSELHPDERAQTVTAFVKRALEFFAGHGITAKRLFSDNGFIYTKNRSLRELLARHEIRHMLIEARRPRPTARSSATSRRSSANGAWASATADRLIVLAPCHTGCTITTSSGATQPLVTARRSVAFGMS